MREQTFVFKTAGDRSLSLVLRTPDASPYEKLPLLVCVTGGGWAQCVKEDILWFIQPVPDMALKAGYAVASIEYRLVAETVLDVIVSDAMDAVRYLVLHGEELKLDTARMAVCGHSAGAHLALMLANAPQERFTADSPFPDVRYSMQCCMAFAPPTVLFNEEDCPAPQAFGHEKALTGHLDDDAYRRLLSPISHVSKTSPQTLLVHGESDPAVFYENSVRYMEKAKTVGAPCSLLTVTGGGHSFETMAEEKPACPTSVEAYEQAGNFLKKVLG